MIDLPEKSFLKRPEHLPLGSRSSDIRNVLRSNSAVDNRADIAYFLEPLVMDTKVGSVLGNRPFVMVGLVLFKGLESLNGGMTEFHGLWLDRSGG